jgi:RNA polymerase sigma-70 factor (ECF subfamily)
MWRRSEKAFRELFETQYTQLEWYAFGIVREGDTARDLVNDAFLQLWQRRDTFPPERDPIPWLKTTIHNRALNHLRDNCKYHPDLEAVLNQNESPSAIHDPLDYKQLQKSILLALDKMPARVKEVFLLSRNEDLKYQQIADRLGISVKTVEVQMGKALRILREHLGEYLPFLFLLMKIFLSQ